MKNIAIFASGTGSNARKIIEHFQNSKIAKVSLVISNKKDAPVLTMAQAYNIDTFVINKAYFYESKEILKKIYTYQIDLIVLAGFLWLIPDYLIDKYFKKIINIHPALLPKYGGKGMYGQYVHQAVWENKEKQSGITIHYANEHYDEGDIIFQASCDLDINDTPSEIGKKVLQLEHKYYSKIIESLLTQ